MTKILYASAATIPSLVQRSIKMLF